MVQGVVAHGLVGIATAAAAATVMMSRLGGGGAAAGKSDAELFELLPDGLELLLDVLEVVLLLAGPGGACAGRVERCRGRGDGGGTVAAGCLALMVGRRGRSSRCRLGRPGGGSSGPAGTGCCCAVRRCPRSSR